MTELKEIGHNIILHDFVIHRIVKDAGSRNAVLKKAANTIKITDREKIFIAKVADAYYKKSSPMYGIFEENNSNNKFQEKLKLYENKQIDFYNFSLNSMEFYKLIITQSAPATGGFVVFAHYTNTDKNYEFLLVFAMNNKDGFFFDESSLTLKSIQNLDISKIDVASQINLTKWGNFDATKDLNTKTYLSFVKGIKGVSVYFMTFIGCENKTTSTKSSQKLACAVDGYCKSQNLDRESEIKLKDRVHNYCIECINDKREISLNAVSSIVDPDNPNKFKEFASGDDYEVDSIISGDKKVFKTMKTTRFQIKDSLLIEFNNELLDEQVFYNKKEKILTIKDIDLDI